MQSAQYRNYKKKHIMGLFLQKIYSKRNKTSQKHTK